MRIRTTLTTDLYGSLEEFRPEGNLNWELVASGDWSEDMFHSGHIAYYIAKTDNGVWLMDGVERESCLDGVTDEDVAAGALNDDQLQALWGTTLEEAQSLVFRRIVAIVQDAPDGMASAEIARILYEIIEANGGKAIDEPDADGLLDL